MLIVTAVTIPLIASHVSAQSVEYIIIKTDGSIEPAMSPIIREGNLYTVTDDIPQYLVVERNHTTLDGGGHQVGGIYGPLVVQVDYDYTVNGTTDMTITNVVINGKGIVFFSTTNSCFSYITINNGSGIDINGDGNTITNITVNYGRGLSVSGKNNVVYGNCFTDCNYTFAENNPPPYGLNIGGSNNTAIKNHITGTNGSAINLGTSRDNIIFGNQIENNEVGIRTMTIYKQNKAENNTIYNNNFIGNQRNLHDEMIMTTPPSFTIWDYNTIGNYWSDYAGLDFNGDGKGDTPYFIDEDNQDHYPLMKPVDINSISNIPSPSPSVSPTSAATASITPTTTPSTSSSPSPTAPMQTVNTSPHIPEREPFPTSILVAVLILLVLVFASVLLFRRHRKPASSDK